MKVQSISTESGERYLLLDDDYSVIEPVRRYLKYLDICGRSPHTLRTYAYHLKLYYDYLALQGIDALEVASAPGARPADTLSGFLFWLQYPESAQGIVHLSAEVSVRSDNSVNQILNAVLGFYQYLAANREIRELEVYQTQRRSRQYKPFLYELMHHKAELSRSMFKKRLPKPELKYITRKQYETLLTCAGTRRDRLLLALLFEGGLRLSEALGMHIEDLCRLEDGVFRIVPREDNRNGARVKRNAAGIIKVPDYVVDLAVKYLVSDLMEYDTDYVFINYTGKFAGEPMSLSGAEKLFDRLSRRAGFEVHPHMLRHGFATEKLEAGWELVDIQVYLRHKNIVSTQIYAQYTDELKKEKMRAFLQQKEEDMRRIAHAIR